LRKVLHRGGARRPGLPTHTRRELVGRFDEDIALLEHLVGRSFTAWREDKDRGGFAARTTSTPVDGVSTWQRF
jgi:hypothetical protein